MKNGKINIFNIEQHLIRIGYFDGFCERLLDIELLVDLELNFELSFCTFRSEQITKHGKLPDIINTELLELIELDLSLLKEDYNIHEGATDFPFYVIVVNQFGENWKYTIGEIPIKLEGYSNEEKVFFKTLLTLRNFLIEQTGYEIN